MRAHEICKEIIRHCEPELAGLSRRIHDDPEHAFTADYGNGELLVGLFAEYDALPKIGHACGHNVIAAAAVGAVIGLASVAYDLGITVRVIRHSGQGTGGGKVLMLERGVFDDLDLAMLVHPGLEEVCAPISLAITDLEGCYTGRAAQAASALELGVNVTDAVTLAQAAVGLLRQHLEPKQMVHGMVTEGGAAPNIVPARATAVYNLRAADSGSLQRLENRIRACFEAGATWTGCTHGVVQLSPEYARLEPDEWLSEAYRRAIVELGREPLKVAAERDRLIGSTDMDVIQALPAIHPVIAVECGDAMKHQAEFAAACATPPRTGQCSMARSRWLGLPQRRPRTRISGLAWWRPRGTAPVYRRRLSHREAWRDRSGFSRPRARKGGRGIKRCRAGPGSSRQ